MCDDGIPTVHTHVHAYAIVKAIKHNLPITPYSMYIQLMRCIMSYTEEQESAMYIYAVNEYTA